MRRLIIDIYRIVFRLTGAKLLAIGVGLVYMTLLNLVMIYGLGLLMEGWLPFMSIVHKLFAFPFYIVTALASSIAVLSPLSKCIRLNCKYVAMNIMGTKADAASASFQLSKNAISRAHERQPSI